MTNLKILYFHGLFAFIGGAFSFTAPANEQTHYESIQKPNTFVINCNRCSIANIQSKIKHIAIENLHSGKYQFIVFDIERGNLRQFNVVTTGTNKSTKLSNNVKISLQNSFNAKLLEQQVTDATKAIDKIRKAYNNTYEIWSSIKKSSDFISAYSALTKPKQFNHYLANQINSNSTIADATKIANLKLDMLSKSLEIEKQTVIKAVTYERIKTNTRAKFSDNTRITFYPYIQYNKNKQLEVSIDVTTRTYQGSGAVLPKNQFDLTGYQNGGVGFNAQAFLNFFNAKGFTIIDKDNLLGKPNHCKAKWACEGKACTLAKTLSNCM